MNLENYVIEKINRNQIHGAPYNPRKINDDARRKLRDDLEKFGLLGPIIVNRRTMNIVSGHQRIGIMDQIQGREDYELTVSMVDLDDRAEVEANILLNNQAVMGEWDTDKLNQVRLEFPDLNFESDLGFSPDDIEDIFAGSELGTVAPDEPAPPPKPATYHAKMEIIVTTSDEGEAEDLYQELTERGLKCRISTL